MAYQIFSKDGQPMKHKLNSNVDYFVYLIFETLEEALQYNMYNTYVKKIHIKENKKRLKNEK
jgi:hypothetical protein